MKTLSNIVTAIILCGALDVYADATLTFELNTPDSQPQTRIISLARFFARIDDPAQPDSYLLFQAGKFFPLYRVDLAGHSYTQLTPEVTPTLHAEQKPAPETPKAEAPVAQVQTTAAADVATDTDAGSVPEAPAPEPAPASEAQSSAADQAPDSPADASANAEAKLETTLHLTSKSRQIAGINCRVVEELLDRQPVIRHCMADRARLGITEREIRSLARTFVMARERDFDWLATATKDEKFVSIASEDLRSHHSLQLQSVSTKPLPPAHLRIPREFSKTPNP